MANWENICNKIPIPLIHKKFLDSSVQKCTRKGARAINHQFTGTTATKQKTNQKNQQMINNHKRWSALFQIKEKQIQTKRYYFLSLNDLGNDPKGFVMPFVGENVGKEEVLCRG